jgi:hypothetical protein
MAKLIKKNVSKMLKNPIYYIITKRIENWNEKIGTKLFTTRANFKTSPDPSPVFYHNFLIGHPCFSE